MINVTLNDEKIPFSEARHYFHNVATWARENCPSFKTYNVTDVSDFSIRYDLVAEYSFDDEQDVVLFKLRWS